jgi:hypothetical protein
MGMGRTTEKQLKKGELTASEFTAADLTAANAVRRTMPMPSALETLLPVKIALLFVGMGNKRTFE